MLKREITYTDYSDEEKEVTETFYFNLSKREIAELDIVDGEESFEDWYKKVTKNNDRRAMYDKFKGIILSAYGVRSEDGKRFIKNPEIQKEFEESAAFDSLFNEFVTTPDAMFTFFAGVLPKELGPEFQKAMAEMKTTDKVPSTTDT